MRIQEKGGGDRQGQPQGSGNPHDRSGTPGGGGNMTMVVDDEMRPNSRTSAPPLGPPYGGSSNPPVSTTVAYPYSAWNVSGAPQGNHVPQPPTSSAASSHKAVDVHPNMGGNSSGNNVSGGGNMMGERSGSVGSGTGPGGVLSGGGGGGGGSGGGGGPPAEPKPLLSSQYEELSDEDDGNGN